MVQNPFVKINIIALYDNCELQIVYSSHRAFHNAIDINIKNSTQFDNNSSG